MKFNKGKYKVLHLWRYNAMHQYQLGAEWLKTSFADKNL